MDYLETLARCVGYGAAVGAGIALVSVIADEIRGYRRMKRFAAQAQERRRGPHGIF